MVTLSSDIGTRVTLRVKGLHAALFLAVAIRLALAPYTFQSDIATWYNSVIYMLTGLDPYEGIGYAYTPLWLYLLAPIFTPLSLIADPAGYATEVRGLDSLVNFLGYDFSPVTAPLFTLMLKLPMVVGDTLMGLLLYRVVSLVAGESKGRLALVLWLFNPAVIFHGAIHGQFDVWPALFTFIAFWCLLQRRYWLAGLALSMGFWLKVYPAMFGPLYLAIIAAQTVAAASGVTLGRRAWWIGLNWLKLAAGFFIPFALFLGPLIGTRFLEAAFGIRFTREGVALHFGDVRTVGGGLNFWALRDQPPIGGFIVDHAEKIGSLTDLAQLAGILAIAVAAGLMYRRNPSGTILYAHSATLAVLLLTARVVNPQYILWILPFLIAMFTIWERYRELAGIALISLSSLLFGFFLLDTVQGFFLPLAIWNPMAGLSLNSIYNDLLDLPRASKAPLVAIGVAATVALLQVFSCLPRRLPQPFPMPVAAETDPPDLSDDNSIPNEDAISRLRRMFRAPRKSPATVTSSLSRLLISLVVVFVVGQLVYYGNSIFWRKASAEVEGSVLLARENVSRMTVWYRAAAGSFPLQGRVVAAPLTDERIRQPDIYVYLDESYPALGTGWENVRGLYRHINAQLGMRGYRGTIRLMDARGLAQLLNSDPHAVLVMGSTVIPDTVVDDKGTLGPLRRWLEQGGTLVWAGHALGYWVGHAGDPPGREAMGEKGWQTLIGPKPYVQENIRGFEAIGDRASPLAQTLDIQFKMAWIGASLKDLVSMGGQPLGWLRPSRTGTGNVFSSVAHMPIGQGHVVMFGWNLGIAEPEIARDIAKIILSGYLVTDGRYLSYQELRADRGQRIQGALDLTIPSDAKAVVVTFFSQYPHVKLYQQEIIPIAPLAVESLPESRR